MHVETNMVLSKMFATKNNKMEHVKNFYLCSLSSQAFSSCLNFKLLYEKVYAAVISGKDRLKMT